MSPIKLFSTVRLEEPNVVAYNLIYNQIKELIFKGFEVWNEEADSKEITMPYQRGLNKEISNIFTKEQYIEYMLLLFDELSRYEHISHNYDDPSKHELWYIYDTMIMARP
jgi:hypothetical protein|tara:strand:- start:181 stop:510 length:330 start_codon:yes stop_codon:yes gene_type:complete